MPAEISAVVSPADARVVSRCRRQADSARARTVATMVGRIQRGGDSERTGDREEVGLQREKRPEEEDSKDDRRGLGDPGGASGIRHEKIFSIGH